MLPAGNCVTHSANIRMSMVYCKLPRKQCVCTYCEKQQGLRLHQHPFLHVFCPKELLLAARVSIPPISPTRQPSDRPYSALQTRADYTPTVTQIDLDSHFVLGMCRSLCIFFDVIACAVREESWSFEPQRPLLCNPAICV